ncbi:hypothetical protein FMEXI_8898 [Fusarium mexicanum]|uniref:Uncharacterized protein n=1 Tax=Fusarium mexicanum TaxID=751941 RepID=A0A8H5MS78_9HYPO|nr:hypothetical protein FMEXI_8898 [Fusarium mexicanum]
MSRPIECVGMKLDAYILNTSVVADTYFLAPTNKPVYEGLLPGRFNLRHDVIPAVDLNTAYPSSQNSRISDLQSGEVIESRLGVYLHWCVPKPFRSGRAHAGGSQKPATSKEDSNSQYPNSGEVEYESVPDQWLVFRYVAASEPTTVAPPALEIFFVESSTVRKLKDVLATGEDIEMGTSPFLDPTHPAEDQLRTVLGKVSSLTTNASDQTDSIQTECYSPLTVLGTGNPLFADYMPHNTGVFTIHDDLTWGGQAAGTIQSATVSYAVYGFSSQDIPKPSSEPVTPPSSNTKSTGTTAPATATDPSLPIRVCWGTLYSVEYQKSASPTPTKAVGMAQDFKAKTPLAVGSDIMDACIAMLSGSQDPEDSSMADVLRGLCGATALQESNAQLDRASSATTNFKSAHGGYRWRLAIDQTENTGGSPSLIPTGQPSVMSSDQIAALRQLNQAQSYLDALFRRKRYVRHLIFCEWWKHRNLQGEQDRLSVQRRADAVSKAEILLDRMKMIDSLAAEAQKLLTTIETNQKAFGPFSRVARAKFYSNTDPVFAVQDMGSGWPKGWDKEATLVSSDAISSWVATNASVLADWLHQSTFSAANSPPTDIPIAGIWEQMFASFDNSSLSALPTDMQTSIKNLMISFSQDLLSGQAPTNPLIANPAWDSWSGQPWLPVFVEWEVEYAHIPYNQWQLCYRDDGTVAYGLIPESSLASLNLTSRIFSGRSLLMSHAQKLIVGLLNMVYPSVSGAGPQQAQDKAWMIEFLSGLNLSFGRLDGFTDHLLTLYQGVHVTPPKTQITLSSTDDPIIKARVAKLEAGEEIFADQENLKIFYGSVPSSVEENVGAAGGLDVTPYGIDHEGLTYAAAGGLNTSSGNDPFFRPVTHGQARLKQFKLIDRFGQVICATDPRPGQTATPFYPYIGDGIMCEPCTEPSAAGAATGTKQANTAIPLSSDELSSGDCPWFQLGPRINQDARLHAKFMCDQYTTGDKQSSTGKYRPVSEGESGVFAWLLINYNNQSLQVYDGDGSFRGEAFLPSDPKDSVYWQTLLGKGHGPDILPYMTPAEYEPILQQQLKQLASQDSKSSSGPMPMSLGDLIISMSQAPFLIALWETVVASQDFVQSPPPKQYSQFPPALVGRPVALARLGLGIELATAPMCSQAYADYPGNDPMTTQPPATTTSATKDSVHASHTDQKTSQATVPEVVDPSEGTGEEDLTRYDFPVKIGDMLGKTDGLVAYFSPPANSTDGSAWAIVTDYTGSADTSSSNVIQHTAKAAPLTVSPAYPRLLPIPTTGKQKINITEEVVNYDLRAADSIYSPIIAVMVDPFLPVHVRSAILPVTSAKLDGAVVNSELQRLGVWLQTGPVLIGARGADPVADVKGLATTQTAGADVLAPTSAQPSLRVPVFTAGQAGGGTEWKWVQPMGDETGSVNYHELGVVPPMKEGFDCLAGTDPYTAKGKSIKLATALDGYLILRGK